MTNTQRIESLEKSFSAMEERVSLFATRTESRFASLESKIDSRFDELLRLLGAKDRSPECTHPQFAETENSDPNTTIRGDPNLNSRSQDLGDEFRLAAKRVELPSFDGHDPRGWITRAETYFEVQEISESNKVKLARLSMDGPTIHWFQTWLDSVDNPNWFEFKKALILRFGVGNLDNPFEELADLRQKGSVEEYIEEFEFLSAQVGKLPEIQSVGLFMKGLKNNIRLRVRTLCPRDRLEAMRVARCVEAELAGSLETASSRTRSWNNSGFVKGFRGGGQYQQRDNNISQQGIRSRTNSFSSGSANSNGNRSELPTSSNLSVNRKSSEQFVKSRGVRHLSNQEIHDRRTKGLCFKCGEKYHPLHQCVDGKLRVVILGDDEEISAEEGIARIEDTDSDPEDAQLDCNDLLRKVQFQWIVRIS